MPNRFAAVALLLLLDLNPAHGQLRGHGGPVRSLAIAPDGKTAVSGSFDTSAIRWSLPDNAAEQVLRFHDSAVNAVLLLNDGGIASSGEDGRIAIWKKGQAEPASVFEGHTAPVVALAQSPDASLLASASWDRTARIWPLTGSGEPRVFEGHTQNVNAVAFTPDGAALVTAGYDATVRITPLAGGGAPIVTTLPTPLNAVAIAPDGEIATAGGDGKVYLLSSAGERESERLLRIVRTSMEDLKKTMQDVARTVQQQFARLSDIKLPDYSAQSVPRVHRRWLLHVALPGQGPVSHDSCTSVYLFVLPKFILQ